MSSDLAVSRMTGTFEVLRSSAMRSAVHARHHHVEQDEMHLLHGGKPQHLAAVVASSTS